MSRDLRHILLAFLGTGSIACSSSPAPRLSAVVTAAASCDERFDGALREITLTHGNIYDNRRITLDTTGTVAIHHRHMANGPGAMFNVRERRCLDAKAAGPLLAGLVELLRGPEKKEDAQGTDSTLCLETWTWPDGRKESPPSPGRCFDIAAAAPLQAALPSFEPTADTPCLPGAQLCGVKLESGATPHPHERYPTLFDTALVAADGAWWCLRPSGEPSEYELVRGRLPQAQAGSLLAWLLDGVATSPARGDSGRFQIGGGFQSTWQSAWLLRPEGSAMLNAKETALIRQRFSQLAPQLSPACVLR